MYLILRAVYTIKCMIEGDLKKLEYFTNRGSVNDKLGDSGT